MSNQTTASFGIDHPLIAIHDVDALRHLLISIGFNMTAIGKHPWGTSTSLAIFPNCLLEIMGIYDDTLLDEKPTGDFRFGRHVYDYLQLREGVALTALHSTDSTADAQHASACGLTVSGHLEFGRDVRLPDGTNDRTKTTLALLPNSTHPRLSFFLCQQHRRDLVEVEQWMQHPNTVSGIKSITIMESQENQSAIRKTLCSLYGDAQDIQGGFSVQTSNGAIRVLNKQTIIELAGDLPDAVIQDNQAAIVGMEFKCTRLDSLKNAIESAGVAYKLEQNTITLTQPELTGNTILSFSQS